MAKITLLVVILGFAAGWLIFQSHPRLPASALNEIILSTPPTPPPIALPSRLIIPRLNIDTAIESVGLDKHQRMDVPQNPYQVGWYQYGPKPGEKGSAVIDGHIDTPTGAAVFVSLNQLQPGDEIIVVDKKNVTHPFQVIQSEVYSDQQFPINTVFNLQDEIRLNLITCEGVFNRATRNYSNRLVVYSILKP